MTPSEDFKVQAEKACRYAQAKMVDQPYASTLAENYIHKLLLEAYERGLKDGGMFDLPVITGGGPSGAPAAPTVRPSMYQPPANPLTWNRDARRFERMHA